MSDHTTLTIDPASAPATTESPAGHPIPLMGEHISPPSDAESAQYRIDEVQLLNWGGYCDLQVMPVGRSGTALLGPSGRGKSTLLDAIAAVVMPNPQEFNQAARDDKGRRQERTVYSYARGLTVNTRDSNQRSSTPSYIRPAGRGGFASGAAITWSSDAGQKVTAFRVSWIGPDTTDNAAVGRGTVYGFVHDAFSLSQLDGLAPVRAGAPPISVGSLERLVDPLRGDVVKSSQSAVHEKMRVVMNMGATEESQMLALRLLRRAQASKGIFSIDVLFKEFVLTEPLAVKRWDTTLEHFTEANRLYDAFELSRRKLETLKNLPEEAEKYRAALTDSRAKRSMLRADDAASAPRLRVWHAGKSLERAEHYLTEMGRKQRQSQDELRTARQAQERAEAEHKRALEALTHAGGDQSTLLRERLDAAIREQRVIESRRSQVEAKLRKFGLSLPASSTELSATTGEFAAIEARLQEEHDSLRAAQESKAGELSALSQQITSSEQELRRLETTRSNIPADHDERRNRIATAVGIPPENLPYVGELLDIQPAHQGWEHAIVSIIRPLAQDLVVSERDFPAVRAWVNEHNIGGKVTLAPAAENRPLIEHHPGTIPAMLDIVQGPYRGWVSEQLSRYTYECVEKDTELAAPFEDGVIGRVTRAGMRTGHGRRVVKDDTREHYRWIGRDNRPLRSRLTEELAGCKRQREELKKQLITSRAATDDALKSIGELTRLAGELDWQAIDLAPTTQDIAALTAELTKVDTPENIQLRDALKASDERLYAAKRAVEILKQSQQSFEAAQAAWVRVQDTCNDILEESQPLTEDELATTDQLLYEEPVLDGIDPQDRRADERVDAAVEHTYLVCARRLGEQIAEHDEIRAMLERYLIQTIHAYRAIDERSAREVDDHIDSLPDLERIRERLIADDLPSTRENWLAKVNKDLVSGLHALLVQIDTDTDDIVRGLKPINEVLTTVEFRHGSSLSIDPVPRPNSYLTNFRKVVERYVQDNPAGVDLFNGPDAVEKSFLQLRKDLARLTESSHAGENWRRQVFDAREHVTFRAIERRPDGTDIIHEGVSGMSGGEGQELIAFILGAALRYRLGEGGETLPGYGSIILDEGFVKADSDYTGRSLSALQALGFQLIIGAPREKATAFEDFVDSVAYINTDPANPRSVRIYTMTISEALQLDELDS